MDTDIDHLLAQIRACDICAHAPKPLPISPNPVLAASPRSKIRIISQAPGTRVHASSKPFTDPSGARLRDWLGVSEAEFYNYDNFAFTPMGFCFPGQNVKGADLPPRKECAPLWQQRLTDTLPNIELTLLIGMYAVKAYLGDQAKATLTQTVAHWQDYGPDIIPMPHPSWRNNGWIKKHDWFADQLTFLKARISDIIAP